MPDVPNFVCLVKGHDAVCSVFYCDNCRTYVSIFKFKCHRCKVEVLAPTKTLHLGAIESKDLACPRCCSVAAREE